MAGISSGIVREMHGLQAAEMLLKHANQKGPAGTKQMYLQGLAGRQKTRLRRLF